MAALALPALGAAIGNFAIPAGFLGVSGAGIGWAIGGMLGSSLQTQRVEGPRLADLKLTSSAYGSPIPYVLGTVRGGGQIIWGSSKREISTTTSRRAKGGPKVKSTTYTYEVDILIKLTCNRMDGIRKIFVNGELQWTAADDADFGSINASTALASRITAYRGDPDQLPDPTYEAAVGIGNAPAYRGSLTVMLAGLQLGNAGQIPNLTFEMVQRSSDSVNTDTLLTRAGVEGVGIAVSTAEKTFAASANNIPSGNDAWSFAYVDATGQTFEPGTQTLTGYGYEVGGRIDRPVIVGAGTFFTNTLILKFPEDPLPMVFTGIAPAPKFLLKEDHLIASTGTVLNRYSITASLDPQVSVTIANPIRSFAIVDDELYAFRSYGTGGGTAVRSIDVYDLETLSLLQTISTPAVEVSSELLEDEFGNLMILGQTKLYRYAQGQWEEVMTVPLGYGAYQSTNDTQYGVSPAYIDGSLYTTRVLGTGGGAYSQYVRVAWPAIESESIPLDDAVIELCERCSVDPSIVDAASLGSKGVRGYAITPSSTRQAIEVLAQAYQFEAACSDALRFVLLGGAPKKAIPWSDVGTTQPGNQVAALPLSERNDIELPGFVTVKYMNGVNDYQDGAERSARIASNSDAEQFMELPLVLSPSEAKQCADFTANIIQASLTSVGPITLQTKHSTLEPTDVVLLTLDDDSTLRTRFSKTQWAEGILNVSEAIFDNASAVISSGATDEDYTSTSSIRVPSITVWEYGDWPLMRDVDDNIGYYWAARGLSDNWPGAVLMESSDDLVFSQVSEMTDSTLIGFASNTLGNWTGGYYTDTGNSITVNFGNGVPSSITDAELLAQDKNAFMIGAELVFVRDWAYVSPGVYRGSNLLRGRKGTLWAMSSHGPNEPVVLIQLSGIRRVVDSIVDLNVPFYYRAITFGRPIDSAASRIEANTGVSAKPYAPTNLAATRNGTTTTVSWNRRTRLDENWILGLVPLGEESEEWHITRYTNNTYSTVAEEVTSNTNSYTFNVAGTVYLDVQQVSARVGDGYTLRGEI